MTVAETIYKQLGHKARVMIGAKQFVAGDNMLRFRIGRNSSAANMIRISLEPMDTYKIEFLSVRGMSCKTKAEHSGVYADMMHSIITQETGLYTCL